MSGASGRPLDTVDTVRIVDIAGGQAAPLGRQGTHRRGPRRAGCRHGGTLGRRGAPHVAVVKVGLELFCRFGPDVVDAVRGGTGDGTVPRPQAARHPGDGRRCGPRRRGAAAAFLTVHASGGPAMVRAAVEAAPDVEIAAVTVLTSLGAATWS